MRFGCLTRPWNNLPLATCFDGVAAAGYDCIGLLGRPEGPIIGADTPSDQVDSIREQLDARGLEPIVVWSRSGVDLDVLRGELANVKRVGAGTLLHCGVAQEAQYEAFYQLLIEGADAAAELGLTLAVKPHGGVTTVAADLLRVLKLVDKPNFVVWYDPGNIQYYSGADVVADVQQVAGKLAGCCIKDCTGSAPTGDGKVMLTPGDGEIDLAKVFEIMLAAGYDGPNMVECISGTTPEELVAQAAITRERMQEWFRA